MVSTSGCRVTGARMLYRIIVCGVLRSSFAVNRQSLLAGCLLAFWAAGPAFGQVVAERFYPPVVTSGSESTVKVDGKLPQWPVKVACDRADVRITAGDEASQFTVAVDEDAPPGIVWVRLFDDGSASPLLPLLITRAAVIEESEPNDKVAEVTSVEIPATFYGRLEKNGDVDGFRTSVKAGDTILISVTANRVLASPMDAVLQVTDMKGNILAQSDDIRGIDPQLVFTAPRDDEIIVRLFAFPETPNSTIGFSGAASFVYSMAITAGPFLDYVLPFVMPVESGQNARAAGLNLTAAPSVQTRQAPDAASPGVAFLTEGLGWQSQVPLGREAAVAFESDEPEQTREVDQLPVIFSGRLDQPNQVDRIRFPVQAGKKYRGEVHARRFGVLLDSVLRVVDPESGKELAKNDDRQRQQYDAAVDFTAPADGALELQVSELSGAFGRRRAYSVEIAEVSPSVRVSVAADRFVLKPGEATKVQVTIVRKDGFAQQLRISAGGLPTGVDADAVISEAKGDSSKAVELQLTAGESAPEHGTFQIVATEIDEEGNPTEQTTTATFALRDDWDISEFWLTVAKPAAAQ